MPAVEQFMRPSEVGRALGVSYQRVRQLTADGRLPATRTALGNLYDPQTVERLAREREQRRLSITSTARDAR